MNPKSEIWRLTINYFPRAAAAGVTPISVNFGMLLSKEAESYPAWYGTHEFFFQHPPTREDFINSLNGMVWAQQAWGDTLLPLIRDRRNQWPIINDWYKAGHTDITDDKGLKVARIDLDRVRITVNRPYYTLGITVDDRNAFINRRVHHSKRDQAREIVRENEHRIRERVMEMAAERQDLPLRPDLMSAIEEVLAAAGIIKPAKVRAPRKTKEAA